MPLEGDESIPSLFPPKLWINSWTNWVSKPLVRQPIKEKEDSDFKPVFCWKSDIVSYPVRLAFCCTQLFNGYRAIVSKIVSQTITPVVSSTLTAYLRFARLNLIVGIRETVSNSGFQGTQVFQCCNLLSFFA